MKYSLILLLAVVLLCAQSCTIEKRHYRNGFYVSAHTHAEDGPGFLNREKQQPENVNEADPEIAEVSSACEVEDVYANPDLPVVTEGENSVTVTATAGTEFIPATNDAEQMGNESKSPEPAPKIEQDKNQAIGAGVAAALFFLLGMTGLIITGTSGSAGIFIGAAFLCFVLCVILASLLYPREPVVKKAKEEESHTDRVVLKIGIGLMITAILGILTLGFLALQILFGII